MNTLYVLSEQFLSNEISKYGEKIIFQNYNRQAKGAWKGDGGGAWEVEFEKGAEPGEGGWLVRSRRRRRGGSAAFIDSVEACRQKTLLLNEFCDWIFDMAALLRLNFLSGNRGR